VQSGWDLHEMRTASVSLEEIFLQLTGDSAAPGGKSTSPKPQEVMPA